MNETKRHLKPWPADALIIVAPSPPEAVRDPAFPAVPGLCRDCCRAVLVRLDSIARAAAMPERKGRPIEFFCVKCAAGYDGRTIEVFRDYRERAG